MNNKGLYNISRGIYHYAKENMEDKNKFKNIGVIRTLEDYYVEKLKKSGINNITLNKQNSDKEEYFAERLGLSIDGVIVTIKFEFMGLNNGNTHLIKSIKILTIDLKSNSKNLIVIDDSGVDYRKSINRLPNGFKDVFKQLDI